MKVADTNSMIRVGIVMDVDEEKKRVRVYYPDLSNMVSDWLIVPQRPFHGNAQFAPFHVHASTGSVDDHSHPVYIYYSDNIWQFKVFFDCSSIIRTRICYF